MDWATRRVLSWRLSNTLDAGFCVEALAEALDCYGRPEIFNTDQGSQFTSFEFTAVLKNAGVAISMDGRGRCMDNIFIERLWRSLKYEAVYLHELPDGFAAQKATVAAQAPPLVCPSAGSTRTQSHDKQDAGGMIGRPEYTLSRPPSCPTNRDHLSWRKIDLRKN